MNTDKTLKKRGNSYENFSGHAVVTQNIKTAMRNTQNWTIIDENKKECLEMVAHNIGRILNGNHNYHDSWLDIIKYVTLIEKEMRPK